MAVQKENYLKSPNFAFLEIHEPQLVRLGTRLLLLISSDRTYLVLGECDRYRQKGVFARR